jgi:16S rRNA (guanine527-N7)-methyltransferase
MAPNPSPSPDALRRELAERLPAGLARLGQSLPAGAEARIIDYLVELARWNRAYNLTAVTEPAELVERHVLDSLSIRPHLRGRCILDAGTGPGLPGAILAIAEPGRRFVLLDSAGKKIRFLRHVARTLALDNVEPVQARLESWQPENPPDEIVARALAPLPRLVQWVSPWLDRGARLLAMKGPAGRDEAVALPAGYSVAIEPVAWPDAEAERFVIEVRRDGRDSAPA